MEWLFVDGSYVIAHQHSSGAATEDDEAIAKSRGGNTTKIHLSVAACGYPLAFEITGGNIHDSTAAPQLLAQTPDAESVIADKVMTVKLSVSKLWNKGGILLFHARRILVRVMVISTGDYIIPMAFSNYAITAQSLEQRLRSRPDSPSSLFHAVQQHSTASS